VTAPTFETRVETIDDVPGAAYVHFRGRLTLDEVPELRKSILGEIGETSASRLAFELSGVEKLDTAGAAVLIEAIRAGHRRGLKLLLCSPSESVVQMFQLAGLEDVLDYCCSTPEETRRRLLAEGASPAEDRNA
jgi:anti-anti-sigma factor